jgi:outer membrane protein assembly factor BamB
MKCRCGGLCVGILSCEGRESGAPVGNMILKRLPRIPLITLALAAAGVMFVRSLPEFERNLKSWLTAGIPLLALILNLIWFAFTKRFSGRTRGLGIAAAVLIVFGLKASLRVDGTVDGTGMPRFVWKWAAQSHPQLAKLTPGAADAGTPASDAARLALAADVPQFFGPNRDGLVTGVKLAHEWKTKAPRELWRQPIGAGWSAFAVVNGRTYTQEQRGEDELITCYDLLTGRLVWAHADKARFFQWQGGEGPRATPSVHQGRVYACGATGLLNCLDAATGKPVWQRAVLEDNKLQNIEWGVSASPLIVDDKVIVTGGKTQGRVLFAYQCTTGVPLWKAGDDQASYASPILATVAGRRIIMSNNARALTGYDPASGAVLFDHAWGGEKWPKASQPVVISADRVFISAGYGMGCRMLQIKAEPDGKLSATEVWSNMKMKTQFNSPALREGHLYGLDDGRLACLDAASGERLWKEGRFASGQSLLAGDVVIVQSESGPVHLCAAKPQGFEEIGRLNALSSKTWNHPVLAGRYLLVRNDREAVCYELP